MANAVERLSNAFGNQLLARSFRPGEYEQASFLARDSDSEDSSVSDEGPKKPDFGVAPEEVGVMHTAHMVVVVGHTDGLREQPQGNSAPSAITLYRT